MSDERKQMGEEVVERKRKKENKVTNAMESWWRVKVTDLEIFSYAREISDDGNAQRLQVRARTHACLMHLSA